MTVQRRAESGARRALRYPLMDRRTEQQKQRRGRGLMGAHGGCRSHGQTLAWGLPTWVLLPGTVLFTQRINTFVHRISKARPEGTPGGRMPWGRALCSHLHPRGSPPWACFSQGLRGTNGGKGHLQEAPSFSQPALPGPPSLLLGSPRQSPTCARPDPSSASPPFCGRDASLGQGLGLLATSCPRGELPVAVAPSVEGSDVLEAGTWAGPAAAPSGQGGGRLPPQPDT